MTLPTPKAGVNCDVTLSLHSSETLPTGLTDKDMGFMLATDSKGSPIYSVKDLAPGELVSRVQAQGYEINPQTLEVTFYKDNWSGPFGAYEDRPGQGRPALTEGIDAKNRHPVLAPKKYTMTYKVRTATTISFSTTTPGTILDSGNGLAEFKTGDIITVTGSASNNGTYNISTGAVAGTIRTTEATTAEVAGASVTITVTNNSQIAGVENFANNTYVITANRFVFKVTNWGTAGSSYLVSVFKHSDANAIFAGLHVHNGYLYAMCGTTAAYAYSADGTTWVESNRGGTDQQATEMITLRGVLHKRVGNNNHYQLTASTDTGINGGTAWSSADQIGDTSYAIGRMLVLSDSLVFATNNGLENLDGEGNVTSLMPGLADISGVARPNAAVAWLNTAIVLPLADGSVKVYQEGRAIPASPASQVEKILDAVTQMINPSITESITYSAAAGDFIYGFQLDSDDDMRIIEMEHLGEGRYIWRSFLASRATSPLFSKIFATYVTNTGSAGPVLWIDASTSATRLQYWLLPVGRDALQDSRCKYESSGVIYDPWITMGCPEIQKRWSHIEVACTQSTPASYAKTTYTCDGINEAGTDKIATNSLTMAQGITIGTITFDANSISRRMRLVHTLGNTGASQEAETPILLWIRAHAFALPTPKYAFSMALDVPTATVGHGVATQDQARRFLAAVRTAQLPMTLTDRFGSSWTVNRVVGDPTEGYTKLDGRRTEEVYSLTLVQQPVGV